MYSQKKSNNNNKNHHIVKTMKTILTIISINDTITGIITTSIFTIEFQMSVSTNNILVNIYTFTITIKITKTNLNLHKF